MEDYQQRVIDEKEELDSKIKKLNAFIVGEVFSTVPADERDRLISQVYCMQEYSNVLGERIEAFQ